MLVYSFTVDVSDLDSQFSKQIRVEPLDHGNDLPGVSARYILTDDADDRELGIFSIVENDEGFTFEGDGFLADKELKIILEQIKESHHDSDNWIESPFTVRISHEAYKNDYLITPTARTFRIELDGKLICVLQHNDQWEEISDMQVPEDLLRDFADAIENHYQLNDNDSFDEDIEDK